MSDTLRHRKEDFVSGHDGAPPLLVFAQAVLLMPALTSVSAYAAAALSQAFPISLKPLTHASWFRACFECLFLLLPLLACVTAYPLVALIAGALWIGSALAHYLARGETLPAVSSLRLLRGAIAVLTAVCILAVDFQMFPRSSAKTETFGVSLMDTGVGVVAMSGGLTSRAARDIVVSRNFKESALRFVPLLLLSIARPLVHAALHLPLHASEYGLEWNFFSTLTALSFFDDFVVVPCVVFIRPRVSATGLAAATMSFAFGLLVVSHVTLLSSLSPVGLLSRSESHFAMLSEWILYGVRGSGFYERNREGIHSLIGFASLHLCGVSAGVAGATRSARVAAGCAIFATAALIASGMSWNYFSATDLFARGHALPDGYPLSRRLANAPYVAWSALLLMSSLLIWRIVSLTIPVKAPASVLLEAAGAFPGPVFLLANILTGLSNSIADAIWGGGLDTPTSWAFAICFIYIVAVSLCAFRLGISSVGL